MSAPICHIDVLDKGYVKLYTPVESILPLTTICDVARCCTRSGAFNFSTGMAEKDLRLLKFLYRNGHLQPFEFVDIIFIIKSPIFVRSHFVRHRTAKVCEQSQRYCEMDQAEFYIPDEFTKNIEGNRQMTERIFMNEDEKFNIELEIYEYLKKVGDLYRNLRAKGVSREQSRMYLPVSTYTTFCYKMDLRNLMHMLELRCAKGAQFETRVYAQAIRTIAYSVFSHLQEIIVNHMKVDE